ncbi:FAD-binding oxidoreductase [Penicillium robsamsonii]|uniref:FAD-binding oxidoreductase n=1 Tax=Penicillium robsamsonii TaxID=1792511 RepID=UPI002547D2E8|nr:FAD-binding oxidoreductase [Penicillium robsamsonii]KAJ5816160.1 FAD-binding oxidoreductase [Penicillium robsamsonii]
MPRLYRILQYTLAAAGAMATPVQTCHKLGAAIDNSTFLRDSDVYTALVHNHWSQIAWKRPTCIFLPSTAQDLQVAVPMLTAAKTRFAIRSGGHMPAEGAASIDNGVLVDLSKLTDLRYDGDASHVSVGSGLRWGEVYSQLDEHQVTVVGGRVLDVGVGGLPLGGGLSYLSDLYGLACDNVVNFEVILADGSLINANFTSHPDLFWALKGGANNFGIVTTYTLKTYPIYQVWGGSRIIAWEHAETLIDAIQQYQSLPNKDLYANINLNAAAINTTDVGLILQMVYLKPEEYPVAFNLFSEIPTLLDTTGLKTLSAMMGEFPTPTLPRIDHWVLTVKPTKSLYDVIKEQMLRSPHLDDIRSVTAGSVSFSFQPISSSLVEAGQQNGGNALGLEAVNQTWFHIDSAWWWPEDDDKVLGASRAMMDVIEETAKEEGSYLSYLFMNDANRRQEVIAHYGEESTRKLHQVQRRYDPSRVFQKLVPGGFKLPRGRN